MEEQTARGAPNNSPLVFTVILGPLYIPSLSIMCSILAVHLYLTAFPGDTGSDMFGVVLLSFILLDGPVSCLHSKVYFDARAPGWMAHTNSISTGALGDGIMMYRSSFIPS